MQRHWAALGIDDQVAFAIVANVSELRILGCVQDDRRGIHVFLCDTLDMTWIQHWWKGVFFLSNVECCGRVELERMLLSRPEVITTEEVDAALRLRRREWRFDQWFSRPNSQPQRSSKKRKREDSEDGHGRPDEGPYDGGPGTGNDEGGDNGNDSGDLAAGGDGKPAGCGRHAKIPRRTSGCREPSRGYDKPTSEVVVDNESDVWANIRPVPAEEWLRLAFGSDNDDHDDTNGETNSVDEAMVNHGRGKNSVNSRVLDWRLQVPEDQVEEDAVELGHALEGDAGDVGRDGE
ncbi:hypothetical protein DACRYDRAFT_117546 [Dacryopinax primogenitus]|uniref:Uncharacterized protein n=1 Tax=Dacryopinax primogenitus (strain DJM 731) TaxID=1858805 RepID=M5FRS6_DACPD|nr:uncharacterized protein DACRYDRAFT_117546 [Dacryopinax primogenitus]EJT99920.1 hypothetical protein DACRYDRAFT_117546 [Dacryopinax primogenitus]